MNPNPPPTAASAVSNGALRAAAVQIHELTPFIVEEPRLSQWAAIIDRELNLTAKDAAAAKVLAAWDEYNKHKGSIGPFIQTLAELRALHQADDNEE